MVKESNNDTFQELFIENPDLMHLVESSGNKLLFISRLIPTPGAATN